MAKRKSKPKKQRKRNRTVRLYQAFFAMKKAEMYREHPKGKRFFPWLKLTLITPWALIWRWLRKDWHLFLYFAIWVVIVSCEVWVPYLMGLMTWGTDASKWWFSIGSACWIWWAGPGTPFLAICLALTVATDAAVKGIKKAISKRRERRHGKDKQAIEAKDEGNAKGEGKENDR